MSLATLIPLVMKASIFLSVFALGLDARLSDALYLFRRPWKLVRSMVSMNLIMPVFATIVVMTFELHPAVELALVTLSLAPVPPLLPKKATKAGGRESYARGLLVAAALLSIVITPLAVGLFGKLFGTSASISPMAIAQIVGIAILLPLAAGMFVRYLVPAFAERISKPLGLVATVLLLAAVIPVLFKFWPAISSLIGDGTLVALAAFVLVGLVAGHLLGGPEQEDRAVLAISTSSRHPGVAAAIVLPDQKLVLPALLLYLIVNAIVGIPYQKWLARGKEERS